MAREPDYDIEDWEKCASCDEGVEKSQAFYDSKTREFFHPDCAGVWRCVNCGTFNPDELLICNCGEEKGK